MLDDGDDDDVIERVGGCEPYFDDDNGLLANQEEEVSFDEFIQTSMFVSHAIHGKNNTCVELLLSTKVNVKLPMVDNSPDNILML